MSETLYQQAHKAYLADGSHTTLQKEFEMMLASDCGFVLSSPDVFCLARCVFLATEDNKPMLTDDGSIFGEETIIDPIFEFLPEHWNCWHIHVLAGDMEKLFTWMPFKLPFVSWEKRGRLRAYELKHVFKHV